MLKKWGWLWGALIILVLGGVGGAGNLDSPQSWPGSGPVSQGVDYSTGLMHPLSTDSSGNLKTSSSGGSVAATVTQGTAAATVGAWPMIVTDATHTAPVSNTNGLSVAIVPALPAGTNLMGKVGIDQTTPGTTNGVQVNAALPAGTNVIGKATIDQTTPGTTNKVSIGTDGTVALNAAIPAGANLIGKTGIDQTTPGTTNGVQINAALPAGTALLGKTGIDQTTPGTTNKVSLGSDIINSVLTAGSAIVGKVSAVDSGGTDATDTTNHAIKVSVIPALPAGTNLLGKTGIDQTTPGTTNGVQVNAALPAGTNDIGIADTGALIPNSATQKISSSTFTAGSSNSSATIAATSAKFSCLEQMIVHMDVSTAVVAGNVTISDGTWTINVKCVDTTTAGAWCPYDGPVLQSTAVNTTITVTVPAMTNGGAGDAMAIGYVRAGGC